MLDYLRAGRRKARRSGTEDTSENFSRNHKFLLPLVNSVQPKNCMRSRCSVNQWVLDRHWVLRNSASKKGTNVKGVNKYHGEQDSTWYLPPMERHPQKMTVEGYLIQLALSHSPSVLEHRSRSSEESRGGGRRSLGDLRVPHEILNRVSGQLVLIHW